VIYVSRVCRTLPTTAAQEVCHLLIGHNSHYPLSIVPHTIRSLPNVYGIHDSRRLQTLLGTHSLNDRVPAGGPADGLVLRLHAKRLCCNALPSGGRPAIVQGQEL
jgi:hypothetical protein